MKILPSKNFDRHTSTFCAKLSGAEDLPDTLRDGAIVPLAHQHTAEGNELQH
jgi:hypothetical protein